MPKLSLCAGLCALAFLAGCAQVDELLHGKPKPAAAVASEPADGAYATYIGQQTGAAIASLRNIYIAPVNLANMQVIQPEGSSADAEWWVTEEENQILQRVITQEFAAALGYQSAFNIVYNPAQADIILDTAVVALHPNETRGSLARAGNLGGAITVSIALISASNQKVVLRLVDTRAGDDIWAFNLVKKDDPALGSAFRAWGAAIRHSLLTAQGRPAA